MQKQKLPQAYAVRLEEYGLGDLDLSGAVLLKLDRGEWLLNEGHPIDYLYFLLSGKAAVSSSAENGRCLLLCYYISEGIIGDIEMMTGRRNAISSMQAITPLTCIGLPLERYAPELLNNLPFVLRAAAGIAEKLNDSVKNCTATILQPFEQRLCVYILQSAHDGCFHETLTNVADQLGSSYRHLLRCLQRLCGEGLLEKRKSGYYLLNREALEERAMG
jgi:CRP-like cAMP-binding protein